MKIPSKKEIPSCIALDRFKIGTPRPIDTKNEDAPQSQAGTDTKSPAPLVEIGVPGIAHVEKKRSPKRAEIHIAEGKADQQPID